MANEKRLIEETSITEKQFFAETQYGSGWVVAIEDIANAPTVDAVEVKHGRWEWKPIQNHTWILTCSVCGSEEGTSESYNYCPNCGAKMDGDGNE